MRVIISQRAEFDLAHIFAIISLDRPPSADAFKIAAEKSLRLIGQHSEIGPRVRFRTRHKGLRFWPITDFQNYLVFYFADQNHVSIERVLDGRRDVQRVLRSGEP